MNCIKCNNKIVEGRLKALPNTKVCTECSSVDRYGVINVNNHKTGNEVQIIKDRKLAEKINKMAERKGYGVSRGIKGDY